MMRSFHIMIMSFALFAAVGLTFIASEVLAQNAEELRANVNKDVVGIIAARRTGTMTELAEDLQLALNDSTLRVLPIHGRGSVGNIEDLLYLRGVDIALVQSDVLNFYAKAQIIPNIGGKIRYIASIGPQKAHIIARKNISSVDQLAGARLNIGFTNSGSFMSCSVLLNELGIQVRASNHGHKKALALLKAGKIDAMFWMGGAPIPGLASLDKSDGLHFIDVPSSEIGGITYLPAQLTAEEYPELIQENAPVQTVQVETVLAAYNWPEDHPRYKNVAKFSRRLREEQNALKSGDYHLTWQQLDIGAELAGWQRFE